MLLSGERAGSWLAKVNLPQWLIIGHSVPTTHEGIVFLPLFSTEERACQHAAAEKLDIFELRKIESKTDMVIELEEFQKEGGSRVCFNQDFTGSDVVGYKIQDVLDRLPN